jgi:hypothetical protein
MMSSITVRIEFVLFFDCFFIRSLLNQCPQQKPSLSVDLGVWKLVIIQVGIEIHEEGITNLFVQPSNGFNVF